MPRVTILLFAAAVAAHPLAAQGASSVCRTVNGHSVCSQSGEGLTCQTVNGRTQCLSGPGTMRCDSVNGRTACTATPHPEEALPALPDDRPEGWGALPGMPDTPNIPGAGGGVAVERDAQGLRVRAGGLDLRLGPPLRQGESR